jgi:hypothetical protein
MDWIGQLGRDKNLVRCTKQSSINRQALTVTRAHPRENTPGISSEGSHPSKRLHMGKTLGGPLVCQTEGGCSPTLNILLIPAGQPRGHPKDMQTRRGYYVFATSKCRRQRATNTAHAYVSFCHMNPSMNCVAEIELRTEPEWEPMQCTQL